MRCCHASRGVWQKESKVETRASSCTAGTQDKGKWRLVEIRRMCRLWWCSERPNFCQVLIIIIKNYLFTLLWKLLLELHFSCIYIIELCKTRVVRVCSNRVSVLVHSHRNETVVSTSWSLLVSISPRIELSCFPESMRSQRCIPFAFPVICFIWFSIGRASGETTTTRVGEKEPLTRSHYVPLSVLHVHHVFCPM